MRIARCFLVLLVGMIMCTVILPCPSLSETNTQDPYYTKVNIWYEEPGKILATNYHKGAIIPAGTQVNNVKVSSNSIAFQVEGMHGVIFNIINVPAHTLMKTQELFDLYFSKEDIKKKLGLLSKFSIAEKKHIENGEIAVGIRLNIRPRI